MEELKSAPMTRIAMQYAEMSSTEKTIADFFRENTEKLNFAAAKIAKRIHVSEASLSRFAQKLGYHGYREFIYQYQTTLEAENDKTQSDPGCQRVFSSYYSVLDKTEKLLDSDQINRIVSLIKEKKKIFLYGFGSSGIAGEEFELRLLRVGVDAKVITDFHQLVINESQLQKEVLVIGISLSGETKEILDAMNKAVTRGAATVLLTSNSNLQKQPYNEILLAAAEENLKIRNGITPQLSILILLDLIYAKYLELYQTDDPEDGELWKRIKKYHIEVSQ